MIKGQNMGTDSGLKGEVASAREEGLTPPHMPCPCRFPFLHTERESKLGSGQQKNRTVLGRKESLGRSLGCDLFPGVVVQEAILPAWREGCLGSKPSAPGSASWAVGEDAAALGTWKRELDCRVRALARHTQAPRSTGRSWEPWVVLKSGSWGPGHGPVSGQPVWAWWESGREQME